MIQLISELFTEFHRELASPAWLDKLAAHVQQAIAAHPEYQTSEGIGCAWSEYDEERFMGPRSAVQCDFRMQVRVRRRDSGQEADEDMAWVRYRPPTGTFQTTRQVITTRATHQRDRDAPPVKAFGPDHLVPDSSPIVQHPEVVAHMAKLGELLIDTPRTTGLGLVFVVCLPQGKCGCVPPFPGEWAVVCERVGETVTLAESADPVRWAIAGRAAPRIARRTRRLDRGGYEAVEAAWRGPYAGCWLRSRASRPKACIGSATPTSSDPSGGADRRSPARRRRRHRGRCLTDSWT